MNSAFLLSGAIFLVGGAVTYTVLIAMYGANRTLEERLNEMALKNQLSLADYAHEGGADQLLQEEDKYGSMLVQWAVRHLPAPKVDTPKGEKLMHTLSRAGFTSPGAIRVYQVVRLAVMAGGGVLVLVISTVAGVPSPQPVLFAVIGAVVFNFVLSRYLTSRAHRRQIKLVKELSDVLDLLVVCVEAGLGLGEAIRVVGRESEAQGRLLGAHLNILSGEMAAGVTMAQGLRALADRTGVEEIKALTALLIQSEKLGSQMGPALRASSDSLRNRRRQKAEEAAQKSTIKILFPLVLFVLPAVLLVIVGPAMIQILHTLRGV